MMEKGKKMAKYIDRDQLIDWLKTEIKFKDLSDGLGICLVIMKEDFERAIKHMSRLTMYGAYLLPPPVQNLVC